MLRLKHFTINIFTRDKAGLAANLGLDKNYVRLFRINVFYRLSELERDMKILRSSPEMHTRQKLEILMALRKLGEELSSEEAAFVEKHSNSDMRQFEKVVQICSIIKIQYNRYLQPAICVKSMTINAFFSYSVFLINFRFPKTSLSLNRSFSKWPVITKTSTA